ncbi:metallophosphoesterase family protein [Geofilum rubicundum]|uniref:Ser/Thr protein phosphatase family protein, calcineurin-like superfamily n=1 Tax=Geofilum rubicundum JCM 15548 TaxID=1236989 RepID=A0A0E9LVL7_9BACT|nr:metallophosphoesterase [Geofilum rubicundum]GAO29299.1 Ser/Thr protein phosphatase family protein, calcineurin-like superfamily [Geofilum rubicundum JCM 15548]
MIQTLKFAAIILSVLLVGCKSNPGKNSNAVDATDSVAVTSEFMLEGMADETDSILLRVALLGDAEPKPCAEFPHMDAAVKHVNALAQTLPMDFVIGVGDIAHKGTEIQYEAATEVLQKLTLPFYPIMGNEEHGSTVERYLYFAQMWNSQIESPSYVVNHDKLAFVFASPDHGRDFDDSGAGWILEQLQRLAPKPVVLVVHGAQQGVYPENADKGISNQLFKEQVIAQPNLAVVVSGDLHMDMDRVIHSKKLGHVHYLHVPALERTKIPDETNHTAMFRVMTIVRDGSVSVDTYAVGDTVRNEHAYSFELPLQD